MLEPYRVLDFTDERGELGPMLLGDLGADVIRVEPPEGSAARRCAPFDERQPDPSLASLQFQAFNRNKRSIVLDPDSAADREVLIELIRSVDFIFESARPSPLARYHVDLEEVQQLNPEVVFVRLTPFGDDGPHAELAASDLVIAAMGGPVALQGSFDRAPVRITVPQVWRHAGAEAAAAAMVAHARRVRTAEGQFVDLSAQCAMTWTMLNAMDAHAIQGWNFEREGSPTLPDVLRVENMHPTADGHMIAIPNSKLLGACTEKMIADGVAEPWLRNVDWATYQQRILEPDLQPLNLLDATDMLQRWLARYPKQELYHWGLAHGATLAPVNTLPELLELEHLQRRDYWFEPAGEPAGAPAGVRFPGLWAKATAAPMEVRRQAASLGEHSDEIRAELASGAPRKSSSASSGEGGSLPFSGIKVADFAWVGVGPITSKCLADHGADVVRVESESRPDVLRGHGPFKDDEPGWNRSQFFGDFNTSKRSLALNMKSPESLEIAKRLVLEADVFIESFAPGAIARMGLGYAAVSELNPGLIMVSTCLMGQTGPAAAMAGYGYHAAGIAGFYEVIGWPDRAPSKPWIAYTDTVAPRFLSALVTAALDHRRRTGQGCYIDLAQIEAALHFLGPELLDLQINGHAARRLGNRSRFFAPQGVYRCSGEDQWCAIAVDSDAQWRALCDVLARDDWAQDETLADADGRLAAHDRLDEGISQWTLGQDPLQVMNALQAAGVPAGRVQRSSDLLADPQYQHRGFYRYLDHTEMGRIPYAGHQYRVAGYDNGPRGPAPCLGEHSFEVLSELLGFSDEEVAAAFASGAVG